MTPRIKWVVGIIVTALLISIFIFFFSVSNFPDKTGFNGKTLWDAMELLIIPAVLALGAFFLNRAQRRNEINIATEEREAERQIAKDREEERALQNYLEAMTKLLLDPEQGLRTSDKDSEVRSIAHSRTLTVLRSLNAERKGSILHFLNEANLIKFEKSVVNLRWADLRGADLFKATLEGVDLGEAFLTGAILNRANLGKAFLSGAFLTGANLFGANLTGADLFGANLTGANLRGAFLFGANLKAANLKEANLSFANLRGANLTGANLTGANLTGADDDDKTIWPEGFDPKQAGAEKTNE